MGKKKSKSAFKQGGSAAGGQAAPVSVYGMSQTMLLAWVAVGLGILTLLTYMNSFGAEFVLDNKLVFLMDVRIRELSQRNLYLIFTENYWWPSFVSDLYRPITTLTYLFNYAILGNGQNPAGYHVINFLLHWTNALMVFILLRHVSRSLTVALIAAALFAVHPIGTESVTNLVGRADLLATASILAAGIAYIRALKSTGKARFVWLLFVALISLIGVFCKESAIMIVGLVGLYDMLFRWQKLREHAVSDFMENIRRWVWPNYLALVPCVVGLLWMRHVLIQASPVYGQIFIDNPIADAGFFQTQMTALKVIGLYLGLLLFPWHLSCDYSYNQIPLFLEHSTWTDDAQAVFGALAVLSLLVAAFAAWKSKPLLTFGLLLFFGMLLPTTNMLIPIGSIMGERFLYLPMIGLALPAALALDWGRKIITGVVVATLPRLGWVGWTLPISAICLLGIRAYIRNDDWQNDTSLWTSAIEVCPNSFKVWKGLSNAVLANEPNENGLRKAIAVANRGLYVLDHPPLPIQRQDNTLFYDLGNYYRELGDVLAARGAKDEARQAWLQAIVILDRGRQVDTYVNHASREKRLSRGTRPEDITDVGNYKMHQSLGQTYLQLGDYKEAERSIRYMQQLNPTEPTGCLLLGELYFRQGDLPDTAISLIQALFLDANNEAAWSNLRTVYQKLFVQGVPIISTDGKKNALDDSNPVVRQEIQEAALRMFTTLQKANQKQAAEGMRNMAVNLYHCPPGIFPPPPAM